MASGHGRQVSGAAELPSQSALDTSGFGAWATDPTLIPGMSLPLGTGLEASPSLTQAASGLESARDLSGRSQAASTTASSAWEHGGSAPLADSAALTHLEQGGSPRRSLNRGSSASPSRLARSSSMLETELAGQEQWKVETDPAADTDVPDLSFMLSDTLVLPK
ncbi:hypothetical protein COCSUDRAFT_61574 [Coccomyxa subellipsoidea C-169]|uniref:Uncharacterized protein n=1 Tax=Coccomyxa subellipsoidea (strain C-169) TaxID=574566 RepID=I0Z3Y4_COCSC|nr:hypothetical protein COCSUDRAFT_61574 [Coccomyxa subellipsoidea C-169]EIE25353.1 hypothetical protein COCSUDRAFT_61574 [Coccomyxa subellipsoidea C-169]|eukprot:XP_005649897.1 hypothetical protein COCSUDRAFT_61574 [Coccomyxa subellipsoidea C-169]